MAECDRSFSLPATVFLINLSSVESWIAIKMSDFRDDCVQESWIGGWLTKDGREYTGFDGIRDRLEQNFELVETQDMPMLLRETERKFRWLVSHASVWRRRWYSIPLYQLLSEYELTEKRGFNL